MAALPQPARPFAGRLGPARATRYHASVPSPVGDLLLTGDGDALTGLFLPSSPSRPALDPAWRNDRGPFRRVIAELDAYFAGARRTFDVALAPRGTTFQLGVWRALLDIAYGQTAAYGAIARRIGYPGGARAVGRANAMNPISIIVPCHRVIGADGSLTGYGGGIARKRWLLAHEAAAVARLAAETDRQATGRRHRATGA